MAIFLNQKQTAPQFSTSRKLGCRHFFFERYNTNTLATQAHSLFQRHRKKRQLLSFFTLLLFLLFGQTAKTEEILEPKLNLAYTINMVKFIKWQEDLEKINFCLSSQSKIYPYAKQIERISTGDDRYIVIRINPESIKKCQIVYWDDNSQPVISAELIKKYQENTVFITDSKALQTLGFNIQLFIRNLKIRFFIDIDSVQEKNYQISSKLLRLSKNLD